MKDLQFDELISFEKIKEAVPPSFEKMHHYLNCIDFGAVPNGKVQPIKLTYHLPYRSELGREGFTFIVEEVKSYFSDIHISNHYVPDVENPKYWEHERKVSMFKNPFVRIQSQDITVTLKKEIKF